MVFIRYENVVWLELILDYDFLDTKRYDYLYIYDNLYDYLYIYIDFKAHEMYVRIFNLYMYIIYI